MTSGALKIAANRVGCGNLMRNCRGRRLREPLKYEKVHSFHSSRRIVMTLHELQTQALELPAEERWQLTNALLKSLQPVQQIAQGQSIVERLVGIAKTDGPAPTDEEVATMLDERLAQKYL
jgi:hypothetical protein